MTDEFHPVIDDRLWFVIREFVFDAAARCDGKTPYEQVELRIATTKLAAWARTSAGLPLDVEILFRRDVIANFVAVGVPEYRPAGRGNLRSQLLRMAECLLTSNTPRRLDPLPPSDPTRPYTLREIAELRIWATTQTTQARCVNAQVLLSLGIGAGL